jgi:class 3 adenylate cyclase
VDQAGMVFPFLNRGSLEEQVRQISLSSYVPVLTLEGLTAGVDNVRHDVYLSSKFCDQARVHISRLITKYGNVEDLAVETSNSLVPAFPPPSISPVPKSQVVRAAETGEFKRLLAELQTSSLQRAKYVGNLSVDLIARLAMIKYLRNELGTQFGHVLERCRARLKQYENPRHMNPGLGIALRDRFSELQLSKRAILRFAGQELFLTMRTVEKETLAHMRRSLFGGADLGTYDLFMNQLLFTDDGRDDFINAEHYVLLGKFDRDPDRFEVMLEAAREFLVALNLPMDGDTANVVDGWMNDPENAERLVANGTPDDSTKMGEVQKALLVAWMNMLESYDVMEHVIASYETVRLLGEYPAFLNPQQLKNALISKHERERVETLLREHGKISADKLHAARKRVSSCRGWDRLKMAGRFLRDFMRYHRDLRRLEAMNSAMDMVNVIANEKLRELSTINNTLYEFLLPEEQRPTEEKIAHHVILKADVRDSTAVTENLVSRGLNPASHFGLNFFEPVNKLLSKYGATKVFIEGDAIILCIFGREHEVEGTVARACALGREMVGVVRGYNQKLQTDGLPLLELGIGICYQEGAPMYLVDGSSRIMISQALNDSDRLSSCSRIARKLLKSPGMFNVYAFQTDEGGDGQEMRLRYNIGGIHLNHAAFEKLQHELSLEQRHLELPMLGDHELVSLYIGVVPLTTGAFHKIVVREGLVAKVDAKTLEFREWTDKHYYEVCTNPQVYEFFEALKTESAAAANP